jgi:hypothetical protein
MSEKMSSAASEDDVVTLRVLLTRTRKSAGMQSSHWVELQVFIKTSVGPSIAVLKLLGPEQLIMADKKYDLPVAAKE